MRPTTRCFLGGVAGAVFLFGATFVPGYWRVMPFGAHLLLWLAFMAVVLIVSRCPRCGLPVWLDYIEGAGPLVRYRMRLFGPPRCSRCGHDI
ncbi:MAG: hypothetical protein HY859_15535 [Caulobacterales bacterium]|nr:hypothetical protein [Caulobacterales bacterium]